DDPRGGPALSKPHAGAAPKPPSATQGGRGTVQPRAHCRYVRLPRRQGGRLMSRRTRRSACGCAWHGAWLCRDERLDGDSFASIRSAPWTAARSPLSRNRSPWQRWSKIRTRSMRGCGGRLRFASSRRWACGLSPATTTWSSWAPTRSCFLPSLMTHRSTARSARRPSSPSTVSSTMSCGARSTPSTGPGTSTLTSMTLERPIAADLLNGLAAGDRAELMADYLEPLSVLSLGSVLGVAHLGAAQLRDWFWRLHQGVINFEGNPEREDIGTACSREIDE